METDKPTNAEGMEIVNTDAIISETEVEEETQTNSEGMEVMTLDEMVKKYTDEKVRTIIHAGPYEVRVLTVDFTKISAAYFLNNIDKFFSSEEFKIFSENLSKMSSKYKDDIKLGTLFDDWCKSRRRLIKVTNSAANELDQNLMTVYLARLISSPVEILASLNLGIYQEFCSGIASYASNISPTFGLIMENALLLAPNLRYMGIVGSFFHNLRSELIINSVVEAMRRDRDKFQPLKKWFDETDELQDSVKQLLPYEIDKNDIEGIEKALKELGEEQKIFAAAFMSNIKKDPTLYRDGKFLSKVFFFCKSDAAKEWYKRMVKGVRPSDEESAMVYFRNELQQLERVNVDSGSIIEMGKFSLQVSTLPRLVLCGMNGMSMYHCWKNMQSGSKHRFSDGLRQLAINALSFLETMDKIRFRHKYYNET